MTMSLACSWTGYAVERAPSADRKRQPLHPIEGSKSARQFTFYIQQGGVQEVSVHCIGMVAN